MTIHETRQVHFGPGLGIINGSSFKVTFDLLLTVLHQIDPDCCQLILRRLASPKTTKPVFVGTQPWVTLASIIEKHITLAHLQFQYSAGMPLGVLAQAALQRDLRSSAQALSVYTLMEKKLGNPPAEIEVVRKVCFGLDRLENLLAWVEHFGQPSVLQGLEASLALQATLLADNESELWDTFVARDYNSARPGSLHELHTLMASATAVVLGNKVDWHRFNAESINLPFEWQEEATLLALMTVLLYEVYDHSQVIHTMSQAQAEINTFYEKLRAELEAEAEKEFEQESELPPTPKTPGRSRAQLSLVT